MEKNTFLFLILSGLIFIVYFKFFAPPTPSPQVQVQSLNHDESQPQVDKKNNELIPEEKEVYLKGLEKKITESETFNTLISEEYQAEFSSHAGILKSFRTLAYKETTDEKSPFKDLLRGSEKMQPMAFILSPGAEPINTYYKTLEQSDKFLKSVTETEQLEITRTISQGNRKYSFEVNFTIKNKTEKDLKVAPGLRLAVYNDPAEEKGGFWIFKKMPDLSLPSYFLNNELKTLDKPKDIPDKMQELGNVAWTALNGRYFISALIARTLSNQNRIQYGKRGDLFYTDLQYAPEPIAAGQDKSYSYTVYMGPKDIDLLKGFGVQLEESINFGWFGMIGQPLLMLMKAIHGVFNSWGMAIILLTILIKLVLHPISKKSIQSMKAMGKLQPKLKELREKYKDDKQRLNMETMNLFKAHKVNPMGGCLPMLLQMPIYIALYRVFFNSLELYHSPFLFYKDLAAPDPYYISPILLGVFMFLQQKLTPSASADPAQQKMMMFMPLMFSVFLIYLPSGLVIYIFINTMMSVVQQYMANNDLSFIKLLKRNK